MLKFFTINALFLSLAALTTNNAQALDAPTGSVILKVTGNITQTNVGSEAHFDSEMLEALTQHTTQTSTPWHDGVVSFEGPLGKALIEAVGVEGELLKVVALNDYFAMVPVSDFYDYEVILAMRVNGQLLRIRDHGPLFVIYPFDDNPSLLSEEILTRSVWQVKRIEVE
ncbi:hypothetical protein M0220_09380 [Halomonas qinghailakensis]|uniref:Oxidoreductase n=1 Tax=Halomonas qinghailakensis TaxID=2937790 RepID=A0AA46TMI2_9GAMM|nr:MULTISPECIES: hypothetical protein [Halomonas]UYO73113.1 hypothetical protein M0220_09380 [Halomonas sp. ZZQ-149]